MLMAHVKPVIRTAGDPGLFIQHGADLTIQDNQGRTVFDAAKGKGPLRQEALRIAVQKQNQPSPVPFPHTEGKCAKQKRPEAISLPGVRCGEPKNWRLKTEYRPLVAGDCSPVTSH